MWIQVRDNQGKLVRLDGLSKLTSIENLRELINKEFEEAEPALQRLLFKGKQLEDGCSLYDYNVGMNDLIQLFLRPKHVDIEVKKDDDVTFSSEKVFDDEVNCESEEISVDESRYYKVGDFVDTCEGSEGSWFEGEIVKITLDATNADEFLFDDQGSALLKAHDGFKYYVMFMGCHPDDSPTPCTFGKMRPRAWKCLKYKRVEVGDTLLANYNIEKPGKLGFWYDVNVTEKEEASRTVKNVVVNLIVGDTTLKKTKIKNADEFYQIEKPVPLTERDDELNYHIRNRKQRKRDVQPSCSHCNDSTTRLCKFCACCVCGGKDDPANQILCDECEQAYHTCCLQPKLESVPDEDWYCPECRVDANEVVKAGDRQKSSKRKDKMPSKTNKSNRDWGKGMACAGRQKVNTMVDCSHFGPVPGVEVGSCWRFRIQCSEAGVHRPVVAGISGRETTGANSIVLSGGYADDVDNGNEFFYTGSGGRDLSGNKRTSKQSCDQKLTRMNMALAICCNTKVSAKGGEAVDWKNGKEVRVVRKASKQHSKYCPEEGLRYDGIYKIVKYWPEKGVSGFLVWRYLFRRDDQIPAPWTKAGKQRIKDLGLTIQYPEGYLEKLDLKNAEKAAKKRGSKEEASDQSTEKRFKATEYKLAADLLKLIKSDVRNAATWKECRTFVSSGHQAFIEKVKEQFTCAVCQDVVYQPVTTECLHNICKDCVRRSIKANMTCCPICRREFGSDFEIKVNKSLSVALGQLFPGYGNGRD